MYTKKHWNFITVVNIKYNFFIFWISKFLKIPLKKSKSLIIFHKIFSRKIKRSKKRVLDQVSTFMPEQTKPVTLTWIRRRQPRFQESTSICLEKFYYTFLSLHWSPPFVRSSFAATRYNRRSATPTWFSCLFFLQSKERSYKWNFLLVHEIQISIYLIYWKNS